jgi:membrane-bound lytic murein transglycosylase B
MTSVNPVTIYQQKINQINNRINSKLSSVGINTGFAQVLRSVEQSQDESEVKNTNTLTDVKEAINNLGISSSGLLTQALTQSLSTDDSDSYNLYSGFGSFGMDNINPSAEIGQHTEYEYLIGQAAEKYDVDEILIKAIMKAESDFNPECVSGAGAVGLMQLMPETAKLMGVSDSYDPEQNINAGVGYFKNQLDAFGGDIKMALAAYNCGPTKLRSLGITNLDNSSDFSKLPKETQNYVTKIINSIK